MKKKERKREKKRASQVEQKEIFIEEQGDLIYGLW